MWFQSHTKLFRLCCSYFKSSYYYENAEQFNNSTVWHDCSPRNKSSERMKNRKSERISIPLVWNTSKASLHSVLKEQSLCAILSSKSCCCVVCRLRALFFINWNIGFLKCAQTCLFAKTIGIYYRPLHYSLNKDH